MSNKRSKIKISWENIPPDPPSLPRFSHGYILALQIIHTVSFAPFPHLNEIRYNYVSYFDLSGNKLTLDDLGQVMEEVLDVSAQWYHLGLQLKVRTGTLDRIRTQFHDPRDQLLEMLKVWLTTSDNTSWKTLKDALKSRSVGASQMAGVLETKYCLVEGTEVASTSDVDVISPPPPELKQMVPQPRVTDAQASEFKYTHLNI